MKRNLMGLYGLMMKLVKMKMEKVLQKTRMSFCCDVLSLDLFYFFSNFLVLDMLTLGR